MSTTPERPGVGIGQRPRMRRCQDGQRQQPILVPPGDLPGNGTAPVVTNKMGLGKAGGIEQRHHISGRRGGSIIPPAGGARSSGVAALTRRERSQPCRVKPTRDRLEADRLLRESVQQHHSRPIRRS